MRQRILSTLFLLALCLPLAAPAAAQSGWEGRRDKDDKKKTWDREQAVRDKGEKLEVIDVKLEVTDLATGETTVYQRAQAPVESIPLAVGEKVRLSFFGTAIKNDKGVRVELPARYDVSAGDWRIQINPQRDGDLIVQAVAPNEEHRGNPGSRSQVKYDFVDRYEMRRGLAGGFVTFDISGGVVADARLTRAEELTTTLFRGILDRDPEPDELDIYSETIYENGYDGVQQVARVLALQAQRTPRPRADLSYSQLAAERATDLYQNLLGRELSYEQLIRLDPGFAGTIRLLQERGLAEVVGMLVDSEEFQQRHDIDEFEELPKTTTAVKLGG